MKIAANNRGYYKSKIEKNNPVPFKATLTEIRQSNNLALQRSEICKGKSMAIEGLIKYFEQIRHKLPPNFQFRLDRPNNFPEPVASIKSLMLNRFVQKKLTLAEMDSYFNSPLKTSACSGSETSIPKTNMTEGQFLTAFFRSILRLRNPSSIEVNSSINERRY